MVPGPVKAVVLLFPIDGEGEERRKREDARIAREGQPTVDDRVFWMKQTVSYFDDCNCYQRDFILLLSDFKCMWDNRTYTFSRECE